MGRRHSKKHSRSITKYLFLSIGAVIVLVVLVSWFAFPDWHATAGGFWTLVGVAAVGVVAIAKDVIEIIKTTREMEDSPEGSKNTSKTSVGDEVGTTVDDNIQLGSENEIKVNQPGADVSRNRQIGSRNEISVGSNEDKRTRRS